MFDTNKLQFENISKEVIDNKEIIVDFLLNTECRRIDFSKKFNIASQNIINRYKKTFKIYPTLNIWKSFLLDLIIYSVSNNLINCEDGDLLIFLYIDYRFLNKDGHKKALRNFHNLIQIDSEIEHNYYLLLLATLNNAKDDGDNEFITTFLEGDEKIKGYFLNESSDV